MDLELTGRVAWVTGGSGGIGGAIARVLAEEGCRVAISARDEPKLQSAARQLGALAVRADSGSTAEVSAAASHIAETLGDVEILVNCAAAPGGRVNGPLEQVDDALLLEDVDLKYGGYLRTAQAVAPAMKRRRWGRLVHVGGLSARRSGSYSAGARNIAIVHLSKTLSDELGPHGITSNVIHPAETRTPWLDGVIARDAQSQGLPVAEIEQLLAQSSALRRLVDASEVGYVAAFLASSKAESITGEVIAVGGGADRAVFT